MIAVYLINGTTLTKRQLWANNAAFFCIIILAMKKKIENRYEKN